ncbi:hypothetical protein [Burkholderia vietnamiensis]|uniref:hypothetical protein n=1 Tax=Burkholderia vietnamiensis TaxID=60552 RepID=UPI001CF2E718|nr:hypothetical protein [Burkholderia vietnamiensis]MCA8290502.1 hypothetical protein [Burkholderia vietnamiensis]
MLDYPALVPRLYSGAIQRWRPASAHGRMRAAAPVASSAASASRRALRHFPSFTTFATRRHAPCPPRRTMLHATIFFLSFKFLFVIIQSIPRAIKPLRENQKK